MHANESPVFDDQQVADYLLRHPTFFEHHAELLTRVQLRSAHGPQAVSLQERQAELLREKIRNLEGRVAEMVRHSSENASIAHKIHRWSCALAGVPDARSLPHVISEGLQKEFDVPQVAVRMWQVAGPFMGLPFTLGVSDDAKAFASSLTMPFCGPNLGFEPTTWLPRPDEVQSLALLTLREGPNGSQTPAFGLLVLGSPDPLRFDATMGTDFLSHIAEQASAALGRLRGGIGGNA